MAQSHATHASDVEGHVEGPALLVDSGANGGIAVTKCNMESSINHCVYYTNLHRMVPIEQLETTTNEVSGTTLSEADLMAYGTTLVTPMAQDYAALCPRFAWLPADIIQWIFEVTTQYAWMPYNTVLKRRYKSPNPALNVMRCNEPVTMDTIYSDTATINGGETYAQIFVGTKTLLTDFYGMKSSATFPSTLMDNITARGAPTKLISDRAQVKISKHVQEILCTLFIGAWQSEPVKQHQNFAEQRYQDIKSNTCAIPSLTTLVPLLIAGSYASPMCALYSTVAILQMLTAPHSGRLQAQPMTSVPFRGLISTSLCTTTLTAPPSHLTVRNFAAIG